MLTSYFPLSLSCGILGIPKKLSTLPQKSLYFTLGHSLHFFRFFFNQKRLLALKPFPKNKRIYNDQRGVVTQAQASHIRGSSSSIRWLKRQQSDPYTRMAREQGFAARSAFKLDQILNSYHVTRAQLIIDLGASPGGWTQVLHRRFPCAHIISVDKAPMTPIPNTTQLILDFTNTNTPRIIGNILRDRKIDLLVSDMAPSFCGHKQTDHIRLLALAELAFEFGKLTLKHGANAIFKINRGGTESQFKLLLQQYFERVCYAKPDASYKDSSELFVVALGFIGRNRDDE
ncbi:ribosomal RNA large subunit methyltransferase E-like [Schistocerca gregaria]|uniref:ribosomal RNA large subunit methyltransferase E-like n=1 Tax=Schistocerca gregaria TaxID=7010 RepID=UPI00211DF570|nr:ribosomal RNA large subunit methyltransferase E-like [Schistocerca gregaria]